jgi:hypothetical protein
MFGVWIIAGYEKPGGWRLIIAGYEKPGGWQFGLSLDTKSLVISHLDYHWQFGLLSSTLTRHLSNATTTTTNTILVLFN